MLCCTCVRFVVAVSLLCQFCVDVRDVFVIVLSSMCVCLMLMWCCSCKVFVMRLRRVCVVFCIASVLRLYGCCVALVVLVMSVYVVVVLLLL